MFQLPVDGTAVHADQIGNIAFGIASIKKGFNFVTILKAELFVFLHDNTNYKPLGRKS